MRCRVRGRPQWRRWLPLRALFSQGVALGPALSRPDCAARTFRPADVPAGYTFWSARVDAGYTFPGTEGAGYTFAPADVPTGYTNGRFVYPVGEVADRKVYPAGDEASRRTHSREKRPGSCPRPCVCTEKRARQGGVRLLCGRGADGGHHSRREARITPKERAVATKPPANITVRARNRTP